MKQFYNCKKPSELKIQVKNYLNGFGHFFTFDQDHYNLVLCLVGDIKDKNPELINEELPTRKPMALNDITPFVILEQWLGKMQAKIDRQSATSPETNESELGQEPTQKQPWSDNNPDYILLTKANINLANGKFALSTLSKKVKASGSVRFMRSGQRCKVHIGDFRKFLDSKHPEININGEVIDEYMADLEARKATEKATEKARRRNMK